MCRFRITSTCIILFNNDSFLGNNSKSMTIYRYLEHLKERIKTRGEDRRELREGERTGGEKTGEGDQFF